MVDEINLGNGVTAIFDESKILLISVEKTETAEIEHMIPLDCQSFISLILFGERFWVDKDSDDELKNR